MTLSGQLRAQLDLIDSLIVSQQALQDENDQLRMAQARSRPTTSPTATPPAPATPSAIPAEPSVAHAPAAPELAPTNGKELAQLRAEIDSLRRKLAEQSRFLAQATHELRTPLNAILGLAQLIAEAPEREEADRLVQSLEQQSRFLLDLVNDVLDLSRFESGHAPLDANAVEVRPLLEQTIEMVRPLAEAKELDLVLSVGLDVPTRVRTDAMRTRQILVNLLANGIKFTGRGRVSLNARFQDEDAGRSILRVDVSDTGPGIPAKELAAIFEPFEQGEGNLTAVGSGLGLSIAQKWADALGAQLSVESAVGKGSRFELRLPVEVLEGPPAAHAEPTTAPVNVLLVEDNPLNQRLTSRQLEKLGYTVTVASSAREAVSALEQTRFDVGLIDKVLPDLDGFALVERLRELPAFQRQKPVLIALSAGTSPHDRQESQRLGFVAYVTKPIDLRVLHQTIADAIGRAPEPSQTAPDLPEPVPKTPARRPKPTKRAYQHISLRELERVMEGDDQEAFITQAISLFLEMSPNLLGSLQRALERDERKTVARLAHSLKSNSLLLGASRLHDLCTRLESEAETAEAVALQELADALLNEYRLVSNELEDLERSLSPPEEKP